MHHTCNYMPRNTNKKQLTAWASIETYNKVKALTEGESPSFESISEYILAIINQDLARRELSTDYITQKLLGILDNPEIRELVREKLR